MGKPQYFPPTPTRGSLAYQRLLASHTFQENTYPGLLDASLNPTFKFGHSPKAFEIDKQLYWALNYWRLYQDRSGCTFRTVLLERNAKACWLGAEAGSIKKTVSKLAPLLALPSTFYFNENLFHIGKKGTYHLVHAEDGEACKLEFKLEFNLMVLQPWVQKNHP